MKYSLCTLAAGALVASLGCASTPAAPRELVEARSAYERASGGAASRVALVDLHNARQDLDRAEVAFREDPEADTTRDLAYIALRRSQSAEARGNTLEAAARRQDAGRQAEQLRAQALERARSTVAQQQSTIATERAQRTDAEGRLVASEEARREAERRAQAAVESLRQVSTVREEQRGMVITLSGEVLFAPGQTTLLPIAQQRLQQVAAALRDQGARRIVVEGHTDSVGSNTNNQALSQARAEAVRAFLVSQGVPDTVVAAVGQGEARPVADNDTPEGRANNRRVEIVVSPDRTSATAGNAPR